MPLNWNLFGAANQVSEPIFGDDKDLDAPFVAVDPFRTPAQPRWGRWARPDPNLNDVDSEGCGTTTISQPLSQAPLEECTSFPGVIPASYTIPRDRAPTSRASHRAPSPIRPPSSLRQSPSIIPPSAPAPSARQASTGTPSIRAPSLPDSLLNMDRAASDESRRVSFISPEPLRRTASHVEAASRPAGVHADYHAATPRPSVAFCKSLPEPGVKAKLRRASVYGGRAARASGAFAAFLWRFIPTALYLCVLFRLPALYFSRVARVFENAELCRRDIIRMAAARATQWEKALGGTQSHVYGYQFHEPQGNELSFPLLQFKTTWEQFVDNLLQEWKVLNVISALLTSAVLTILQIEAAAADPIVRTAALLALICTLMSLLYGCLYTVRFGSMKAMYKASEWALEAQKTTTNIFWNVWVMLAMPALWLLWSVASIISFIVSIMAFVWRTGAGGEPADLVTSPSQLLASRVIISGSLALGAVYFALVMRTFTRYGDRIDRRWRENVHEQIRHERRLKATAAGFRGRAPAEGRCSPPMEEMRERKEPSPRVNTSPVLQMC
ncbi:hypothetical protein EV715DRAFT_209473 [Schizophyllum commune]